MNSDKTSTNLTYQFISLAEDIADLLFNLENKKIINQTQRLIFELPIKVKFFYSFFYFSYNFRSVFVKDTINLEC